MRENTLRRQVLWHKVEQGPRRARPLQKMRRRFLGAGLKNRMGGSTMGPGMMPPPTCPDAHGVAAARAVRLQRLRAREAGLMLTALVAHARDCQPEAHRMNDLKRRVLIYRRRPARPQLPPPRGALYDTPILPYGRLAPGPQPAGEPLAGRGQPQPLAPARQSSHDRWGRARHGLRRCRESGLRKTKRVRCRAGRGACTKSCRRPQGTCRQVRCRAWRTSCACWHSRASDTVWTGCGTGPICARERRCGAATAC